MEPSNFPPPVPPAYPPPAGPTAYAQTSPYPSAAPLPAMPPLWNPQAAAGWSLLFTPAFGAWLHASNWRTLGDPAKARSNMIWVWATLAMLVGVALLVFADPNGSLSGSTRYIGLAWLLAWNFATAQGQIKYVKNTLGGNYVKKGWGRPLLIGFGLLAVYIVAIMGVAVVWAMSSPQAMADTVRPLILENWHKKAGLEDATVESLTLDHRDGNLYTGSLEATIHGKHEHLPLQVTRDGSTIQWEFK